ncbi:hypothetical protein [Microbulbifer sp. HZ11]|uniref:hypothetical protein n=1 Tax=unclassified Microbulbifer TaxID=2619833 RepID=UPI0005B7D689|nr:hypothetical protein [Microbulbifer sp. HZ11]
MSFQIRYDNQNRVVFLLLYGEATYENRLQAARQLVAKYGHLKPLRILADVRKVVKLSMTLEEQQRYGRFVASVPELRAARIAILNNPSLNTTAVMRNQARQDGLEFFSFLTEAEALQWLTSTAEVPS